MTFGDRIKPGAKVATNRVQDDPDADDGSGTADRATEQAGRRAKDDLDPNNGSVGSDDRTP